jgi:hypothetical protein
LRLEVSFYNDRSVQLPPPEINATVDSMDSDDEDDQLSAEEIRKIIASQRNAEKVVSIAEASGKVQDIGINMKKDDDSNTLSAFRSNDTSLINKIIDERILSREYRYLLSSSLDVDIRLPFSHELRSDSLTGLGALNFHRL